MDNVIALHITKTPGVCGGRACIAGHRIRVRDIVVWHEKRGYSPDVILAPGFKQSRGPNRLRLIYTDGMAGGWLFTHRLAHRRRPRPERGGRRHWFNWP